MIDQSRARLLELFKARAVSFGRFTLASGKESTYYINSKKVLFNAVHSLRIASILLKPFIPRSAETIYKSFNFPQPWDEVRYEDAWNHPRQAGDLRVLAALEGGKVKPLFPRIDGAAERRASAP